MRADLEVGTGVVAWQDDKVLLGLRQGSHGAGLWAFPGGAFDKDEDETPFDTAKREFWEETGIDPDSCAWGQSYYWGYDTFPDTDRHFITLYFRAVVPSWKSPRIMEPEKVKRWKFFAPDYIKLMRPNETFVGVDKLPLIEKLTYNP